ncbi:glutaredoxin family protein [Spiractinospora alimapuensis]|uniref:glutaredoxin family protein n=1 Tax=Spiractinospora alimapuensis TaxID=2820884 RepID=UPI001F1AA5D9|nr:glutaredoxin family protein [Spiractinospora alimapuensis]QVQ50614.1 glutaredoxin family protein [Spiractinospora alimapuensis]
MDRNGRVEAHTITLLGRAGCHLCDEARDVITRVAADTGAVVHERDIDEASRWERDEYWDKIPVTFVNGAQHDFWRVSEKRLRRALEEG